MNFSGQNALFLSSTKL